MVRYACIARSSPSPERSGGRHILALLVILTFAFQSYVAQTHIHLTPPKVLSIGRAAGDVFAIAGADRSHSKKLPDNDDPEHCPLCQAIALSGNFVAPGVPILPLPTMAVIATEVFQQLSSYRSSFSHSWQSRAPPAI